MALLWCGVSASAGFVLPQGLTDIADEAFMDTAVSYYLTILEGVKTIGRQAFMGSRVLQVKLPASVTYIASDAFRPNTAFEVVPGFYAKQWCIDNGFFYDEMRVWVNVSYAVSYADNPAVLKATCAYPSQMDSYRWETSTDLKNWKVAQGQTGASFQADYSDSLQESYVRCRASVTACCWIPPTMPR